MDFANWHHFTFIKLSEPAASHRTDME